MNGCAYKVQVGDDIRRLPEAACTSLGDLRKAISDLFPEQTSAFFHINIVGDGTNGSSVNRIVADDVSLRRELAGEKAKGAKSIKFSILPGEEDWDLVAEEEEQQNVSSKGTSSPKHVEDSKIPLEKPSEENSANLSQSVIKVSHPNWGSAPDEKKATPDEDEKTSQLSHIVFSCSECQKGITGVRYKCLLCSQPPIHLCEDCESCGVHDPLHALVKIRHPDQCPDTGVIAMKAQEARSNPFGVSVLGLVGVPRKTIVAPKERFFAGWRIRNDGALAWEHGWRLKFVLGEDMRADKVHDVQLPVVMPGQVSEILMEMQAPAIVSPSSASANNKGAQYKMFRGSYRLCTSKGVFVGPPMDYEVKVVPPPTFLASGPNSLPLFPSVPSSSPPAAAPSSAPPAAQPDAQAQKADAPSDSGMAEGDEGFELVQDEDANNKDLNAASKPAAKEVHADLIADVDMQPDPQVDPYVCDLDQLQSMGFSDRTLNLRLLRQGKSVQEVVDFICNSD